MQWVFEHLGPLLLLAGYTVAVIYGYAELKLSMKERDARIEENKKASESTAAALNVHITTDGLHRNADFGERFKTLEATSQENNRLLKEIHSQLNQRRNHG